MRYVSVCSGIEAATVAWHPLGFEPVAFSQFDPLHKGTGPDFASTVLAHHYPLTPNLGDMTRFKEWADYDIDLLVGGTPCQSFSVAGLRKGLADPRGNLMLTYLAIADRYRPKWVVWENVPGVLSSGSGRDFGIFLGALGALGYGFAYRVLDAQYFGVPQRRRRVFVVGCLGDWRSAAAVLFERHCLSGHPAPSRETRERIAPTISARTKGGGGLGTDFDCDGGLVQTYDRQSSGEYGTTPVASTVSARDYKSVSDIVTHSLRGEGFDASEDGTGRGTPLVPIAFNWQDNHAFRASSSSNPLRANQTEAIAIQAGALKLNPKHGPDGVGVRTDGQAYTLEARSEVQAVALRGREGGGTAELSDVPSALRASGGGGDKAHVLQSMQVRRLTPRECERLQGFPDDYTLIPIKKVRRERLFSPRANYDYREIDGEVWQLAADGPRYKALGNSMAVPVMRWLGERIQMIDWIMKQATLEGIAS